MCYTIIVDFTITMWYTNSYKDNIITLPGKKRTLHVDSLLLRMSHPQVMICALLRA